MTIRQLPRSFVAFDLETTGYAPPCKIIEIGAVKIIEGLIVEKYQQFVEPEVMIPPHIVNITGINDGMVTGSPTIEDVLPEFKKFIGELPVAAHNAKFDMNFIDYYAREYGYSFTNKVFDSLYLSRTLVKGLPNYKLGTVARHLDADEPNAHRALSDAMMVANIMLSLYGMIA